MDQQSHLRTDSSKKTKKKRPWLLQLAVISTALCLLGALIVGLAYNLGDWFNQEEDGGKILREEPIVSNLRTGMSRGG